MTEQTSSVQKCWKCGAEGDEAHFCPDCGTLLPTPADCDHFSFFGLKRRLKIDLKALEKTFYALSRKLHPDYFQNRGEEERILSIEKSTALNDAYRTLRNRVSRAQYILRLEGFAADEERKRQVPADLLAEVFELQEVLSEYGDARESGKDPSTLRSRLEASLDELRQRRAAYEEDLETHFEEWDTLLEEDRGGRRLVLAKMDELLGRRAYLNTLIRDIETELRE